MRSFKFHKQAQLFLSVHAQVNNLFNLGCHFLSAKNHRAFRERALSEWTVISYT
jgi:putative transposase